MHLSAQVCNAPLTGNHEYSVSLKKLHFYYQVDAIVSTLKGRADMRLPRYLARSWHVQDTAEISECEISHLSLKYKLSVFACLFIHRGLQSMGPTKGSA